MTDENSDVDGPLTSRHGPHVQRRAAARARSIVGSAPRSELAGAAEFLYAVLRVPGEDRGERGDHA